MLMALPLPPYIREKIVNLFALGHDRPSIQKKIWEDYGRKVHLDTLSHIKRRYGKNIEDAHNHLATSLDTVGAAAIKAKAYRQIDRRLSRAEEDQSKIDELRTQLKAGEITKKEFNIEVARYEVLTTNELIKIADTMHSHTRREDEPGQLSPADQAALQMLVAGIQSGNPVQLIQVLNPNLRNANAETPAPPAGSSRS